MSSPLLLALLMEIMHFTICDVFKIFLNAFKKILVANFLKFIYKSDNKIHIYNVWHDNLLVEGEQADSKIDLQTEDHLGIRN